MNADIMIEQVGSMIAKAEKAVKSEDALRFSQAACNAANAMCSLTHFKTKMAEYTQKAEQDETKLDESS